MTCKTCELVLPEARLDTIKGHLEGAKSVKNIWIERALQLLIKDKLEKNYFLSHVSIQPDPTDPAALIALLPLFPEKAATLAMIKHLSAIKARFTLIFDHFYMQVLVLISGQKKHWRTFF